MSKRALCPSTCAIVTNLKQRASAETDLYNPDSGTLGTFTATGSLNQAREGAGQGVLGAGTDETDVTASRRRMHHPDPELAVGDHRQLGCEHHLRQRQRGERLLGVVQPVGPRLWTVGPGPAVRLHADQRRSLGSAALARPAH